VVRGYKPFNMDTIRLKFPYDLPAGFYFKETITQKLLNLPYANGKRYVWTNNSWRKQRQVQKIYTPKYWIEQDFLDDQKTYFYFEASLPKLLNGENMTALQECQFNEVVEATAKFFKEIEVRIFTHQIENAIPTLLAIGRNINLSQLCPCNLAIKALKSFDYKPNFKYRIVDFSDQRHGGINAETMKVYDKTKELMNNARTKEEIALTEDLKKNPKEIIRIELTLKNYRKIKARLKPYLGNQAPTFKNIFKQEIWEGLLKEEMEAIFNNPLQKILFLSQESQPFIDSFLNEHYKHIQTKDTIKGILTSLQTHGFADTRQRYLKNYDSRQTWYNYLKRLRELQNNFDCTALKNLTNVKIHGHILEQSGIGTASQEELALIFQNRVSKNIDNELCNT